MGAFDGYRIPGYNRYAAYAHDPEEKEVVIERKTREIEPMKKYLKCILTIACERCISKTICKRREK